MRYSTTTTAPAGDIIRLAREAFGPAGLGLQITNLGILEATFSGPTGFISLKIERTGTRTNDVIVETREFDDEARQFIASLPRRSWLGQLLGKLRP